MKIAILAPFNPSSVREFFVNNKDVIDINPNASAVNNLVVGLLKAGEEVIVLTLNPLCRKDKILKGKGIIVYLIGNKPLFKLLTYVPRLSNECRKINTCLQKIINQIDIIHAHWAYEYANACLPYTQFKPVICTFRDWPYAIISNLSKTPLFFYYIKRLLWIQRIKMCNRVINNQNIQLIANSDYTYNILEKAVGSNDRINLIYNSIEDDNILKKPLQPQTNATFVSIASSLDDGRKNIISLVKAFQIVNKKYSESKLMLIGPYHKDRELYKYVKDYNINNVFFCGPKKRNEVLSIIDNSLCLVHPSKEESFGNTIIESMARCKVVIGGKDSGAVPYVLRHGKCGCLCDVNDYEEMASAMLKVIEDDVYRISLIHSATDTLMEYYANSVCIRRHIDLYTRESQSYIKKNI